tara:strand:+ start:3255 stop:3518 length:264 start_codon:yes stop_codon:yes gene_type:complete
MLENQNEAQVTDVKAPSNVTKFATVVGATTTYALLASSAHAEAIEIPAMTDIVTMITGMVAVVASVGMAVLSVYATGRVFKWVKAAF